MNKQLLQHSLLLFQRNQKTYLLLLFTTVLSFSVLLGFLAALDIQWFDKYKNSLSQSSQIILLQEGEIAEDGNYENLLKFKHQLLQMQGVRFYSTSSTDIFLPKAPSSFIEAWFLPLHETKIISGNQLPRPEKIFNIFPAQKGRSYLESDNEVLISKPVADLLAIKEIKDDSEINIAFVKNEKRNWVRLKVVGIIDTELNSVYVSKHYENLGQTYNHYLAIEANDPGIISKLAENMGVPPISSTSFIEIAREQEKKLKLIQGILASILFFVLASNLFGSFENSLKSRKYEIAIKRALGADGKQIVFQFFVEGMVLFFIAFLLTLLLVATVLIVYKAFMLYKGVEIILYISKSSMIIYAITAGSTSVVCSLLFALKSIQSEVIAYLKNETV